VRHANWLIFCNAAQISRGVSDPWFTYNATGSSLKNSDGACLFSHQPLIFSRPLYWGGHSPSMTVWLAVNIDKHSPNISTDKRLIFSWCLQAVPSRCYWCAEMCTECDALQQTTQHAWASTTYLAEQEDNTYAYITLTKIGHLYFCVGAQPI